MLSRPHPMGLYKPLLRRLLFRMDPERAHDMVIGACEVVAKTGLGRGWMKGRHGFSDSRLATRVAGIRFSNPVGLAAGFDKNGRAVDALASLGFSHIEIGSVSLDASRGNPKPRLFRLVDERGIIVNYGLPNDGAHAVLERLARRPAPVPLGINIVKTNRGAGAPCESPESIIAEYIDAVGVLEPVADYLTLNLSCPNTETGRDFFADAARIAELLAALQEAMLAKPVFLKVSPLGGVAAIEKLLKAVEGSPLVSGFIFNLPPGKLESLAGRTDLADKPGAVSGKPVEELINGAIRELYRRMDRTRYAIIGAGGVFSPEDAYRKIRLGASLVQLVTAMVYEGPGLIRVINQGLVTCMERDGIGSIAEAVGTGNGT